MNYLEAAAEGAADALCEKFDLNADDARLAAALREAFRAGRQSAVDDLDAAGFEDAATMLTD